MKKIILSIIVLSAVAIVNNACFEDLNDTSYDGPLVAEFSHLSDTEDEADWISTGSFWATTLTGDYTESPLQVSLVGPQQGEDKEVGYYIADEVYRDQDDNKLKLDEPDHDDWELLETTAVEGEDYDIPDEGVITIPANSSFGPISMELTPTEERVMYIVLEEMDIKPSENYKIFRLTIQPDN
ncbi:MAG: hypothetical protein R6U04_01725 [Bacteroidales bacterium]